MINTDRSVDQHVGELLSGFVDGELTQQQRQLVSLHCDRCEECGENLASLKALRVRIGRANLSELGEDKWRETMDEKGVQTSRSIGWLLFIAGILGIGGVVLISFLFNDEIDAGMKIILVAIYGGLATLLYSVLRQRLIERKTDKYKDLEI